MPAATIYLASSFVWGTLFYMMVSVSMIYQVEVAGLNPLQLVLVGTALEVSAFLFEIPTGVVADTYSRKLSVVIGYFITGLSFILAASIPTFEAIALASFIWGIGWTFISGAHAAWLADEVGTVEAGNLYLKGERIRNYGAFLGIVIAVMLGSIEIHYPYLLAGFLFCGWAIVAFYCMQETGFNPEPRQGISQWRSMGQNFTNGVATIKGSKVLVLLMLVGIVFGTFSEGYDRLSTAHLLRNFVFPRPFGFEPVVLFGFLTATGTVLSIVGVSITERYVDTNHAKQIARTLMGLSLAIVAAVLVFALTGQVWLAIAMSVLLMPIRNVFNPLTTAWLNQHIDSKSRATVLSMHSQSDALGQMVGGPGVGLLGREYGIRLALTVSALLLLPAVWLYRQSRFREKEPDNH